MLLSTLIAFGEYIVIGGIGKLIMCGGAGAYVVVSFNVSFMCIVSFICSVSFMYNVLSFMWGGRGLGYMHLVSVCFLFRYFR